MKLQIPMVLGVLAILAISGCTSETTTTPSGGGSQVQLITKSPSELALQLSDFPTDSGNWTLKERTERTKSDLSNDSIGLGWQRGYYVRYAKVGSQGILEDLTVLEQFVSFYPIENVTISMQTSNPSDENTIAEELSKPNIGDDSIAFRVTDASSGIRSYEIVFAKSNVLETLVMRGTTTDYELLKSLAEKAESKL
jgi:hypothetical protein